MVHDVLKPYADELDEIFQSDWSNHPDFEHISDEITGYYEGNVEQNIVKKHIGTGRYFMYELSTNSWIDEYGEVDVEQIYEVKPVEKTIIVYERI